MPIELTYKLAHAAAWDAANNQMRANGRQEWDEDDFNLAARTLDHLWFQNESERKLEQEEPK